MKICTKCDLYGIKIEEKVYPTVAEVIARNAKILKEIL